MLSDAYSQHAKALCETGFWGKQGAGCIFLARTTKRILLAHRSPYVLEPNTWGSWGGAIDPGENPVNAVIREVKEESGYTEDMDIIPLYVFTSGTFRYFNFLVVVDSEFEPNVDWETQGYKWCVYGEWPSPLHFGLQNLFNDAESINKIKLYLEG